MWKISSKKYRLDTGAADEDSSRRGRWSSEMPTTCKREKERTEGLALLYGG